MSGWLRQLSAKGTSYRSVWAWPGVSARGTCCCATLILGVVVPFVDGLAAGGAVEKAGRVGSRGPVPAPAPCRRFLLPPKEV